MPNSSQRPKVAVIIPVYNPPTRWDESCFEHIISLQALHPQYHFQFTLVNDGSSTKVFRRIGKALKASKTSHRLYNLDGNYGKGKALRKGVSRAQDDADFFVCVDWDFPFGVSIIKEILDKLQGSYDVVLINRGQGYLKEIPFFRSFLTRIWRTFIKKLLLLEIEDTQAGVKGFSKRGVKYFLNCKINSFLHDLEFILNCRGDKLKIAVLPAHLRGGVKLNDFSLTTYFRELKMLSYVILHFYLKPKYSHYFRPKMK